MISTLSPKPYVTLLSQRSAERKRICVLGEVGSAVFQQVLAGISKFRGEQDVSWLVQICGFDAAQSVWRGTSKCECDGFIVCDGHDGFVSALQGQGANVVRIGGSRNHVVCPTIVHDMQMAADLAAQHFSERGFRKIVRLTDREGDSTEGWIVFSETDVSWSNIVCDTVRLPCRRRDGGRALEPAMCDWLRTITPPLAIWACDDEMGLCVVNACVLAGLAVPEEVAVLGVNDDRWICELASPGLSSVRLDGEGAGHQAACYLDKIMRGNHPSREIVVRVPPVGVTLRGSTQVKFSEDRHVAVAMRIIREEACSGLQISELVRRIPIARRLLEHRFKVAVGHTLREEMWRVQFAKARDLLLRTETPVRQVSEICGFKHVEYFRAAFKRYTGLTPLQCRVAKSGNRSIEKMSV